MGPGWSTCKMLCPPILFAAFFLWEEILFWKPVHKVVDIWPDGAAHTTQGRYYIHGKISKSAKDIKSFSNREMGVWGKYQIGDMKNDFQTKMVQIASPPPSSKMRMNPHK